MQLKQRADKIRLILREIFPEVKTQLFHHNPFQLLVATILSAQCTDKQVNQVTPVLFKRLKTPADFATARLKTIENLIRPTGFFHNKAKNIKNCARAILDRHDGQVPRALEEMVKLPGVGRKTANVILNTAFGEPTIAVDTHIFRVANRTGIAPGKTVLEVEKRLLRLVPKEFLQDAHHWLILHGRYTCIARKPRCQSCVISDLCEYQHKCLD